MISYRRLAAPAIFSSILCVCAGAAIAQTPATTWPSSRSAVAVSSPPTAAQTRPTSRSTGPGTASPAARTRLSPPSIGLTYSLNAPVFAAGASPRPVPAPAAGDDDDPAYAGYKKAYELILDERWDEARKAFRDLTKKYPDSEYRDDAEYWIAYSYRETDDDRAMELYKKFVKDYKKSAYFDDALADMDQLMARSMAVTLPRRAVGVNMVAPPAPPAHVSPEDPESGLSITTLPSPALAPMMKMRHLERMLQRGTPLPGLGWTYDNDDLDDETRIRLEAVNAIGMTREDEKGFLALKGIAVSPAEKQVVRIAAIEAMSNYRKHESLPVLVEIARNDTSDEMQLFAIDYIGQAARNKEKAFDALLTLYTSLPAGKVEKRKMVFYAIAGIGNDKAVDFLSTVARSNDDSELRREAIYYLGSIGGEKARDVLIEVLEKKPSH